MRQRRLKRRRIPAQNTPLHALTSGDFARRTGDRQIDGAVLTFVDATSLRNAAVTGVTTRLDLNNEAGFIKIARDITEQRNNLQRQLVKKD